MVECRVKLVDWSTDRAAAERGKKKKKTNIRSQSRLLHPTSQSDCPRPKFLVTTHEITRMAGHPGKIANTAYTTQGRIITSQPCEIRAVRSCMSDARGHTGIDRKDQQKHKQQIHHDAALETLLHIRCSASIVIKEKPRARVETRPDTLKVTAGDSEPGGCLVQRLDPSRPHSRLFSPHWARRVNGDTPNGILQGWRKNFVLRLE